MTTTTTTAATPRQVAFAAALMRDLGMSPQEYLGAWAKPYLSMRQRQGRFDAMDKSTASALIDGLLRECRAKGLR